MHAVEAQRGCNAPVDTDVRRGYVSTNQRVSATADEDGIGEPDTSCADAHTVARKHTIGGCGAVRAESGWFLGQAEALEACVELKARCGSNTACSERPNAATQASRSARDDSLGPDIVTTPFAR